MEPVEDNAPVIAIIAELFKRRVAESKMRVIDLAEELSKRLNGEVNPKSAKDLVHYYRSGIVYGTTSGQTMADDVLARDRLGRFAVALDILGVKEDDPLVDYVRELDPRFVYPI